MAGVSFVDGHIDEPKMIESIQALENFRNDIVDKFIWMCDANDYNKLNLLNIVDAIDCIYDKHIESLLKKARLRENESTGSC